MRHITNAAFAWFQAKADSAKLDVMVQVGQVTTYALFKILR
jgi:hypothetical protein